MLVLVAPRSARDMDLEALQDAADAEQQLVGEPERARLRDALLGADPGLVLALDEPDEIHLVARGRSGLTVRLGTVWHEVELPDWHEGAASTWLADRFVSLLRIFPRISGGTVVDPEEGMSLDPAQQAGLVERYRYRIQAGPDAPMLPVLDLAPGSERFARLAEPVLRRRGSSAADRAWFFTRVAQAGVDRDRAGDPIEVRYMPAMRMVHVVIYDDDGEEAPVTGRLAPGVLEDPPEMPDDLMGRDKDDEAIAYLASLLTWA